VTTIEHEYRPLAGIGIGYCPTDEKRMANRLSLGETRSVCHLVDYVLRTAKTWKGPIGRFKLVIPVSPHDTAVWSSLGPLVLSKDEKRATFERKNFVPEDDLVVAVWNGRTETEGRP
jgi:hypothetical protein